MAAPKKKAPTKAKAAAPRAPAAPPPEPKAIAAEALDELSFHMNTGSDPGSEVLDALIDRLRAHADASILPAIFGLLDDDDASGLLWPVFYVAEDQGDAYLSALLNALPHLRERAPGWAEIAVLRILNTRGEPEDCTASFDALAAAAPVRSRRALGQVLRRIAADPEAELGEDQRSSLARTAAAIDVSLH